MFFLIMSYKGGGRSYDDDDVKGFSKVPLWNGRPEDFQHYVQEIRWYLAATKPSDRPFAAARLVRRMLDSEYTSLRTLMYKLNPDDFNDETGIQRLIQFLENSPMNRQPIPDAGAKLSQYYRKLSRKPQETIPQFLVREEYSYDTMWRSLQRLLREKQLDFSKYEVTEKELRVFCGMRPEESFFYEDELQEEDEELNPPQPPEDESSATTQNPFGSRPASQAGSRAPSHAGSQHDSQKTPPQPAKKLPRKRDLLEMLMSKGLIPLAALDIIRGWMILEATSSTDYEKSLIKASTQNKLGYQEVRSALLSMHEDRGREAQPQRHGRHHKGFHAHWIGSEDDDGWNDPQDYDQCQEHFLGESWHDQESQWEDTMFGQDDQWPDESAEIEEPQGDHDDPEHAAMMSQLQEEEKNLQLLLAENQRNLIQARQAVADAKRDRGWQGQTGKSKPTSTYVSQKGKGKSKFKGNSSSPGFYNSPSQGSSVMWNSKSFPKGGKKGYHFSKGKGKPQKAWFHEMYESGMLALESDLGDIYATTAQSKTSLKTPSASSPLEPGATRCVVDTGATVSAGGQKAVQDLVTELAKVRPDMQVKIVQEAELFSLSLPLKQIDGQEEAVPDLQSGDDWEDQLRRGFKRELDDAVPEVALAMCVRPGMSSRRFIVGLHGQRL